MEEHSGIKKVTAYLKEYAEERLKLSTLIVYEKISRALSGIASTLLIWVLIIFVAIFISLGIAWWIGQMAANPFLGFLIVGGFYLILAVLVYVNREKWIRMPVINSFLKDITHEEA